MIFYDELMSLKKKHPNIKVIYVKERVTGELIEKNIPDSKKSRYFVTGPPEMVAGMKKLLESMKIDEEKIRSEDFSGY